MLMMIILVVMLMMIILVVMLMMMILVGVPNPNVGQIAGGAESICLSSSFISCHRHHHCHKKTQYHYQRTKLCWVWQEQITLP